MHTIRFVGLVALLLSLSSCVSKDKYDAAVAEGEKVRASLAQSMDRALKTAEAKRLELDRKLSLATQSGSQCRRELDEVTAQNAELRGELERLGKDVDKLLSEKGTLASSLDQSRKRLDELRRAQEASEARAALFRQLAQKLKTMIDAGDLSILLRDGRMVLRLPNDVLFDSGRVDIRPTGRTALSEIAAVLRPLQNRHLQVAGHTDNEPIRMSGYASNWHLSTTRALAVVAYLIQQGMPAERLSAAGYGEFDPVASNDSAQGKAKNRRIEIVLQPKIDEMVSVP